MVIIFHCLMLRSEKNNGEQNALSFPKKRNSAKCTVKFTSFINKTKSFTADLTCRPMFVFLSFEVIGCMQRGRLQITSYISFSAEYSKHLSISVETLGTYTLNKCIMMF